MPDVDPVTRDAVIAAYGGRCACCQQTTPAWLNVVHEQLDTMGRQVFRPSDAPTKAGVWAQLQRLGFPAGWVLYCGNCVASHRNGDCPYAS